MTRLRVLTAVALLAFAAPGYGQQTADPEFDAKVARPAYADRHPEVLFDEAHDNFHTSTGRYKPFADLITSDGYRVTAGKDKFTKKSLDGFDVLVVANASPAKGVTPGPAFTKEECDAVHAWVGAGGALLLIADHAPFGTAAEDLGTRFGVGMSKGYTSDKSNSEKAGNEGWLVFSRENKLLGDHAITKGRDDKEKVTRVVSFTGQSLKGPEGSVAFLKLADSAVDRVPPDAKTVPAAGRAQGVAFKVGKGRVVVMGEAAMLSAQIIPDKAKSKEPRRMGMNFPGTDNRQLALNLMHWLSGLTE